MCRTDRLELENPSLKFPQSRPRHAICEEATVDVDQVASRLSPAYYFTVEVRSDPSKPRSKFGHQASPEMARCYKLSGGGNRANDFYSVVTPVTHAVCMTLRPSYRVSS